MRLQPSLLSLVCCMCLSGNADAWPTEGKVVYYRPAAISERCLVPAYLYNFDEDASFSCDRFPPDKIFRFTEAIGGTKIELEFNGEKVTGKWYTDNRNLDSNEVTEVLLDGKKFLRKMSIGGKSDEGRIVGIRKGHVIQATANSESHAQNLGYVRIEIREFGNAIEWRQTQNLEQPVGYMPENERLSLSLESLQEDNARFSPKLLPCPPSNDAINRGYAAPAACDPLPDLSRKTPDNKAK